MGASQQIGGWGEITVEIQNVREEKRRERERARARQSLTSVIWWDVYG